MVVFKRTNIRILNDKIRELDQNKDGKVELNEVKAVLKKQPKDKTIGKGINEMDKPTDLLKISKEKKIPFINTLTLTRCRASKLERS
jgi:hypothetical protein